MDRCLNLAQTPEGYHCVNRLALGTVQFGLPYGIANQTGQVFRSEAKAMLQLALANGIDTLDTAIAYGDSEACLGGVGTQGFKVVTKLPELPEDCGDVRNWVNQQVSTSLSRLGVTKIYGLLVHQSEQLLGSNGAALYQALQALKESGQVQKVGVSIYSPSELDALIPHYYSDLVQAPFNLIDRRIYSTGWMKRLKDNGVEIHIRSVFLQGLLLMKPEERPSKFKPWKNVFDTYDCWLTSENLSPIEATLNYVNSLEFVDRVIIGVDSQNHLQQIFDVFGRPIPAPPVFINGNVEDLINPSKWSSL